MAHASRTVSGLSFSPASVAARVPLRKTRARHVRPVTERRRLICETRADNENKVLPLIAPGKMTLWPLREAKMFSTMENLDLDAVNRQFFFDTNSFVNGNGSSNGSTTGSSNSSDLFLYDDNSSDSAVSSFSYNSDQENRSDCKE